MSRKHITSCLTAWAIVLLLGFPAAAQGLRDMQLFAPADVSTYGGGPEANEGFFAGFDGLMWSISAPEVTTIGQPSAQGREVWYSGLEEQTGTQNNSQNTSVFGADVVTGQRYEMGYIYDHKGLLFNVWRLNSQTQTINATNMDMVFDDREWGGGLDYTHLQGYVDSAKTIIENLPVTFETAKIRNRVRTWGVELEYLWRTAPMHSGGYFEVFAGARYLEFNDEFSVDAAGGTTVDPDDETIILHTGTLADSFWRQDAKNHIIGPQIGARWFKQYGRWMFSTEGRFFAGANNQTSHQSGVFGTLLDPPGDVGEPLALGPTSFEHNYSTTEWSPGVELRIGLDWQLTKSVTIGAGWTGMWIDGIARASDMFNYEFGTDGHNMGILTENNRQDVFMNGANFRIMINR